MNASELAAYGPLLAEVRARITSARSRAALAVNGEMLHLYWDIGRIIGARQQEEGWGAAVLDRLATDIKNDLPEVRGFSRPNLYRMVAFHRAYPTSIAFVSQAVRQIEGPAGAVAPAAPRAEPTVPMLALPWGHHCEIVNKVKDADQRLWYVGRAVDQGWSRSDLTRAIQRDEHGRVGKAATNFERTLPPDQAAAAETFKDPYVFDFLTLGEPFREAELEAGLVAHVERFLVEMG